MLKAYFSFCSVFLDKRKVAQKERLLLYASKLFEYQNVNLVLN